MAKVSSLIDAESINKHERTGAQALEIKPESGLILLFANFRGVWDCAA